MIFLLPTPFIIFFSIFLFLPSWFFLSFFWFFINPASSRPPLSYLCLTFPLHFSSHVTVLMFLIFRYSSCISTSSYFLFVFLSICCFFPLPCLAPVSRDLLSLIYFFIATAPPLPPPSSPLSFFFRSIISFYSSFSSFMLIFLLFFITSPYVSTTS